MFDKMFFATVATAALVGTSAFAEAHMTMPEQVGGYFTYLEDAAQSNDTTIELGPVTTEADGTVVIYDYQGGAIGDMLGSEPVSVGANSDVMVNITSTTSTTIAAVLYAGEPTSPADAIDWIEIDLEG